MNAFISNIYKQGYYCCVSDGLWKSITKILKTFAVWDRIRPRIQRRIANILNGEKL